jgi:hypothetical protein
MSILLMLLLAAIAMATALVLADSGLRMWSAFRVTKGGQPAGMPHARSLPPGRNPARALTDGRATARVSYAGQPARTLRAAA